MPSNAYVVRAATEDDFSAITAIYAHYVLRGTATFEIEPPSCEAMLERRAAVMALGLPFLVAELEGRVVGYAYASAYRPRPAYRFTVEDSIYIDAEHTGQGCGQTLLAALIEACEKGPWMQMIAVIGDSANEASVRLHERFGFQLVGTLRSVGFKFDRWLDTVLMQRMLG
jgi:L-amino acid N-acyltransferase YncA